MNTTADTKKLSHKEKDELIRGILEQQYHSVGNNLPVLMAVIDYIETIDTAFTLAELITITNTLLTGSRFISILASGASIFSIFLSPVASMISIINAWQTGHKMYAYRSVAYTITAWAFDKPIPKASQTVLRNISTGRLVRKDNISIEYNDIWRKTSKNVVDKINMSLISKNVQKDVLKIILRSIAKNNDKKLCSMLLKGFENQFRPIPKISWINNYKISYPL